MPRRRTDIPTLAESFEGLRSDYAAAKSSRFRRRRTGVSAAGSGADFHYRTEAQYLRMMEYARDMDRNDAIVGQVVDRAVSNTVQDGIILDTQTGDDGADKELTARWDDWATDADRCDLAGELTFWEMEQLVLRQVFVDGDLLALPNRSGALELVEAHRLRTPNNTKRNVVHGVLLDPNSRRRLQYWLTKENVDPNRAISRVADIKQYDARDENGYRQVFHIYTGKRISQTRGVTAFAPIFDAAGMFEDINFATMVQRQMVACFAIFRERDIGVSFAEDTQHGQRTAETLADGSSRMVEGIGPGMEFAGLPGEKLSMHSPQVPNPEFFPHMKLILTLIGINLGLPLVMVLMDASETNFSGWRGAIEQARMGFRNNQRRLRNRFHRPVYLWKVRQWLAEDPALRTAAAKSTVNVFKHQWNSPTWPYIQPLQDASADLLRLRNGLISGRRRAAERGIDYDALSTEICEDNAKMIRKAHETAEQLNKDLPGLSVTWREVASLPTPDGVKISLAADPGRQDDKGTTDKPGAAFGRNQRVQGSGFWCEIEYGW